MFFDRIELMGGFMDISIINKIIFDGNTFLDFMHKEKQFQNIDVDIYIKEINNYMNYLLNGSTSLAKEVFNRVNYLNKLFNINITYDYTSYLKKETLVTYSMIETILKNENILNKFLDFENNRKYFLNIPLKEYLIVMDKMISYYEESNITIPKPIFNSFKKVMNKYSLLLKKSQVLYGVKINELLDTNLEHKVMEDVDLNDDAFFIARHIYINLCKLVSFDVNFFAYGSTLDNEITKQIWNKNISQINLIDNAVICNTFSKIYASLLNKIGIETKMAGSYHKYNFLNANGTLIEVDATNKINDNNVSTYDIARVQMGLGTAGFKCYDKHKDIADMIRKSNFKIQYNQKTIDELLEESQLKNFDLDILNNICQNTNMSGLELIIYVKLLLNRTFMNFIQIDYILKKIDNVNFEACLLILYDNVYYILSKKGISSINIEELTWLKQNNKMKYLKKK